MEPISPRLQELEENWRERLHEALSRYQAAKEKLRLTKLEYAHQIPFPDSRLAVHQAQFAEISALRDYVQTLQTLLHLQLHGKIPPPDGEW
jgi:hypothetical protein